MIRNIALSALVTAIVVAVLIASNHSSPPKPVAPHRYTVSQLTAPGGPTGWVYCVIAITDAGAVTSLFCEPTGAADMIPGTDNLVPASPPRLPYATPQAN